MKGYHLVLFGVMQGNDRDGIEGWLKNSIPLLLKRLEGDGYKITILSSLYVFLPLLFSSIFYTCLICMFKLILQLFNRF